METLFRYINQFYRWLGVDRSSNLWDIISPLAVLLLVFCLLKFRAKKRRVVITSGNLKEGFARSRSQFWGKISSLLTGGALGQEQLEEIEELLYGADMGPAVAAKLVEELKKNKASDFKEFFYQLLKSKMSGAQAKVDSSLYGGAEKLVTIMVVGINGAGKTTTIGKLATKLTAQGAKVVVGACDTFRAAAVDQLQVWCDRAGAIMIRAKEGTNPSGVAYEALQKAQSLKATYCILDTAGRLHTKINLMKELGKTQNALKKLDSSAPNHTLLVLDAVTGQNALRQAHEFNQELGLTGLVFTKCDGSSKAGAAIPIVEELQVPILYIGVGERVEDLRVFNLDEYLAALLDL